MTSHLGPGVSQLPCCGQVLGEGAEGDWDGVQLEVRPWGRSPAGETTCWFYDPDTINPEAVAQLTEVWLTPATGSVPSLAPGKVPYVCSPALGDAWG